MRHHAVVLGLFFSACTGAVSDLGPPPLDDGGVTAGGAAVGGGEAGGAPTTAGGVGGGFGSNGGGGAVASGPCSMTGGTRAEQVCRRWRCDRMDLSEGLWSGTVMPCAAGELNDTGRNNALKLVNLYASSPTCRPSRSTRRRTSRRRSAR